MSDIFRKKMSDYAISKKSMFVASIISAASADVFWNNCCSNDEMNTLSNLTTMYFIIFFSIFLHIFYVGFMACVLLFKSDLKKPDPATDKKKVPETES